MKTMTFVDQTILGAPERGDGHDADGVPGNCVQACVASLLGLGLDAIPHFATFGDDWWDELQRFVKEWSDGLYTANCYVPGTRFEGSAADGTWPRHFIATGPSPRGPWNHAVLIDGWTGEMVHDPHPSRAGLAGDPIDLITVQAVAA